MTLKGVPNYRDAGDQGLLAAPGTQRILKSDQLHLWRECQLRAKQPSRTKVYVRDPCSGLHKCWPGRYQDVANHAAIDWPLRRKWKTLHCKSQQGHVPYSTCDFENTGILVPVGYSESHSWLAGLVALVWHSCSGASIEWAFGDQQAMEIANCQRQGG